MGNKIEYINNEAFLYVKNYSLEELKTFENDSIKVIFVCKMKNENDQEKLKELFRILTNNGSIFYKYEGNFNKEELESIKHNSLTKFQLIGIINNYNVIKKEKIEHITDDMLWLSKEKPIKYKKQLEKEFQKEIWTINTLDNDSYLETIIENIKKLTFEIKSKG